MKIVYKRSTEFDYPSNILYCGCGSLLNIKYTQKKVTHIIKCSNEYCITNLQKLKHIELLKYYLPEEIYKMYYTEYLKLNRERSNICNEFWFKKGYTEEEAKNKISEVQDKSKYIDYKNRKTSTRIQYYLDKGYTEEESQKMLSDRQSTFTLEKCIQRHGETEGTRIYVDRQEKWKAKVFNKDTCISKGSSISSNKFIKQLLNLLDVHLKEIALYDINEKFITNKNGKHYKYDLTIGKK